MNIKSLMIMFCQMASTSVAWSQWECPSQLGSSLKPLGDSKLMWGTELTAATGYLTNNAIHNTMGIVGLDYTSNAHSFYVEGGFKYWYRSDYDLGYDFSNGRFGLRELYYQNKSQLGEISLGLQSMRTSDNYLLNERVAGLNYHLNFGNWKINAFGGSVTKDFARNGTFCNVSYLYDILPYRNRPIIGAVLGQTNLAGASIELNTSSETSNQSNDGLGSFSNEISTEKLVKTQSFGLVLYSEFGSWINTPTILSGLYSSTELSHELWLRPEILFQESQNNRAIITTIKVEKGISWANSHRTSITASYYGLWAIDQNATAANLFSNIFAGSVLRLDSPDMPFYQIGIKHTIPDLKTHLKLQYSAQTKASPMQELDIELGKKFFDKLLVNGTYGRVNASSMHLNANLFRLELRLDF